MSTKANPTLIGVFVLGAILIAIGAVFFFGSADLFAKKQTYVSYFTQSISGLSVGSNVKFKGVNIGKVTQILLGIGGKDQPAYAKVFYQVDQNIIVRDFGRGNPHFNLFDIDTDEATGGPGVTRSLGFRELDKRSIVCIDRFHQGASAVHLS